MRCPYCPADVPDLGNHFGGYKCEPCPGVRMAFDASYWPGLVDHYRITDAERAQRKATAVRKRRDARRRELAVAEQMGWGRRGRAPTHEGMRL